MLPFTIRLRVQMLNAWNITEKKKHWRYKLSVVEIFTIRMFWNIAWFVKANVPRIALLQLFPLQNHLLLLPCVNRTQLQIITIGIVEIRYGIMNSISISSILIAYTNKLIWRFVYKILSACDECQYKVFSKQYF